MKMKQSSKSVSKLIVVAIAAFGLVATTTPLANAATKTIVCYKGTTVKKVTAAAPKCPTGYSTKKPAPVKPAPVKSVASTPTKPVANGTAFTGTYKGKIATVWSDSGVTATVTATGTGTVLGMDSLTGLGSSSPSSQCESIAGSGTISGGGNTLKVSFDTASKGCAAESTAPTVVTVTGNAVINGGTGKYAGATGTLKVTGTFAVNATDAGTKESQALSLTLTGSIVTK